MRMMLSCFFLLSHGNAFPDEDLSIQLYVILFTVLIVYIRKITVAGVNPHVITLIRCMYVHVHVGIHVQPGCLGSAVVVM